MVLQEQTANMQNYDVLSGENWNSSSNRMNLNSQSQQSYRIEWDKKRNLKVRHLILVCLFDFNLLQNH